MGDELILITSELIEALEAYREHGVEGWTSYQPVIRGVKLPKMIHGQVMALAVALDVNAEELLVNPRREGVAAEAAGCFVRLLDFCATYGIDLEAEYEAEMEYNRTRAFRHGNRKM